MDDTYDLVPVDEFEALWVGYDVHRMVTEC
jgi:hypothetical protein